MNKRTKYDYDPEAHKWAREKVIKVREKFEGFLERSETEEQKRRWRTVIFALNHELIGGQGCVVTVFDERRATLMETIDSLED